MGLVQVGGGQGQCDQFLNMHYPEKRGRFENVLRGEGGRGSCTLLRYYAHF